MYGQRALEKERNVPEQDPLYGEEMNRIMGNDRQGKQKKKKKKKAALPDPQYLMMLKMIDPNIDMVIMMLLKSSIIEQTMGVAPKRNKIYSDEDISEEDDDPRYGKKKPGRGKALQKEPKLPKKLEEILVNQNKMIETLTGELKSLKSQRQEEGQTEVQKQIERLEKLLEKKEMRSEQEEFQYQLKRVICFDPGHG